MILLSGEIRIASDRTLEGLGRFLSEKLFGGLPFVEDASLDETPAVSLRVLDLDVLLHPSSLPGRYILFVKTYSDVPPREGEELRYTGISRYLLERVQSLGLEAETTRPGAEGG
jgi:hypothetical protein